MKAKMASTKTTRRRKRVFLVGVVILLLVFLFVARYQLQRHSLPGNVQQIRFCYEGSEKQYDLDVQVMQDVLLRTFAYGKRLPLLKSGFMGGQLILITEAGDIEYSLFLKPPRLRVNDDDFWTYEITSEDQSAVLKELKEKAGLPDRIAAAMRQ